MMYVVVATSPFSDTSAAVGPFYLGPRADAASQELEMKGWNTEVCPLLTVGDLEPPVNGEGSGD